MVSWGESGALPLDATSEIMAKRSFQIGDRVTVVGMRKVTYPPGMKDELGKLIFVLVAVCGMAIGPSLSFGQSDAP
jgi:hypothetical protein